MSNLFDFILNIYTIVFVFIWYSYLMVNKIQSSLWTKLSEKYKNTVAGIAFSVLSMMGLQDTVAQTTTFQDNLKKPNIELAKKDSVIDYMYKKISSYYPDEKSYIDSLFTKFESQTRLDTSLFFLDKIYKDIKLKNMDSKKKSQIIICCFEWFLLWWEFYDRHESEIDDATFDYIMKFDKQYTEFLKRYFARVETRMEELLAKIKQLDDKDKQLDDKDKQLDENINKNFMEIETTISWFTVADIKKSESIKKLVIDTYNLSLEVKYTLSQYTLDLYKAAIQK